MNHFVTGYCIIRKGQVIVNGEVCFSLDSYSDFDDFIKKVYQHFQINYLKFFKMDRLSKLGFLTAEILIQNIQGFDKLSKTEMGIVLSNSVSSLDSDLSFNESIVDKENYFPSPSIFVYTLPNILNGEICIKHKIKGENAFLISKKFNVETITDYIKRLIKKQALKTCLNGWVDIVGEDYDSFICFVEPESENIVKTEFNIENISNLYNTI